MTTSRARPDRGRAAPSGPAAAGPPPPDREVHIELLLAPGCPHATAARRILAGCLEQFRFSGPVRERTGDYLSPTVLVDGVDVMGSIDDGDRQACRVEPPSEARILAALEHAATRGAQ